MGTMQIKAENKKYSSPSAGKEPAENERFFLYAEDPEYYPAETMDDFSTDPVEFEDAAAALADDTNVLFNMTAVYNRRSPQFLNTSAKLLDLLKDLAGCCVAKTALEKKAIKIKVLETLNIPDLFSMASFNFRKCHAAFSELSQRFETVNCQAVLDLERRWFGMLERLHATNEKTEAIRSGKVSADEILKRSGYFTSPRRIPQETAARKGLCRKIAPSFPLPRASAAERASRDPETAHSGAKPLPLLELPSSISESFPELPGLKAAAELIRTKARSGESAFSEEETENLIGIWERFTGKPAPVRTDEKDPAPAPARPAGKKKKKKKR